MGRAHILTAIVFRWTEPPETRHEETAQAWPLLGPSPCFDQGSNVGMAAAVIGGSPVTQLGKTLPQCDHGGGEAYV
jgi:hypothetical protein